uniref:FAST kinase domains 3 n=1 Tax=Sphenodon punctatus TaxID=8508 RepID=A0A8D0G749_SPHPU
MVISSSQKPWRGTLSNPVSPCILTVTKVMQYCSQNNILSKPIFDVVAESFVYNADNFTTSQTAEPIAPFGKLNYLPPNAPSLFRKLEKIINARYIQFHPHVLLDLLHSCILIGRYPINFLARMFHPYFLQKLQGPLTPSRVSSKLLSYTKTITGVLC